METDFGKVELLKQEVSEKHGVELGYVLIRCHCGNSWGCTPINGFIPVKYMICQKCAMEKIYQQEKNNG